MPVDPTQAYLRTKVTTASPAELRILLIDGAIRFAEQTRRGYESRDFELALDGTTKCQAILTELMCSLRPELNQELCQRLSSLYTFMFKRMVEASISKSPSIVQEVLGLLQYERETWALLMQQLGPSGLRQSDAETQTSGAQPTGSGTPSTPRVSLQG